MSSSDDYLMRKLRELLEDFDVIFTGAHMALIESSEYLQDFKQNITAAAIASSLRISSIDYTKKNYLPDLRESDRDLSSAYIEAYKELKEYVISSVERLDSEDKRLPSPGVFAASIVLERLISSFFSAHLLYRLGNTYEGHAVSRLLLEQMAWAYAVHKLPDLKKIKATSPSKSISSLKAFVPKAGKLYGFLSKKTHLDYESHPEFLRVKDGKNFIIHSHIKFEEYASVLLNLADIFVLVWESTQFEYIDETISVEKKNDQILPLEKRIFLNVIERCLNEIKSLT
ncbi:MAG: hypothetical protein WEA58_13950 [Balneolaceae bacterium]